MLTPTGWYVCTAPIDLRCGVDRLLLGSDAEQIARIAPVPVMLVRQPHRKGIT